jgi:hypothetical protein
MDYLLFRQHANRSRSNLPRDRLLRNESLLRGDPQNKKLLQFSFMNKPQEVQQPNIKLESTQGQIPEAKLRNEPQLKNEKPLPVKPSLPDIKILKQKGALPISKKTLRRRGVLKRLLDDTEDVKDSADRLMESKTLPQEFTEYASEVIEDLRKMTPEEKAQNTRVGETEEETGDRLMIERFKKDNERIERIWNKIDAKKAKRLARTSRKIKKGIPRRREILSKTPTMAEAIQSGGIIPGEAQAQPVQAKAKSQVKAKSQAPEFESSIETGGPLDPTEVRQQQQAMMRKAQEPARLDKELDRVTGYLQSLHPTVLDTMRADFKKSKGIDIQEPIPRELGQMYIDYVKKRYPELKNPVVKRPIVRVVETPEEQSEALKELDALQGMDPETEMTFQYSVLENVERATKTQLMNMIRPLKTHTFEDGKNFNEKMQDLYKKNFSQLGVEELKKVAQLLHNEFKSEEGVLASPKIELSKKIIPPEVVSKLTSVITKNKTKFPKIDGIWLVLYKDGSYMLGNKGNKKGSLRSWFQTRTAINNESKEAIDNQIPTELKTKSKKGGRVFYFNKHDDKILNLLKNPSVHFPEVPKKTDEVLNEIALRLAAL